MKKLHLIGMTLLLSLCALSACNNKGEKEPELSFATENVGGFTKRKIDNASGTAAEFGERFTMDAFTMNKVDNLRIFYPVRGEFKSLVFSSFVPGFSNEAIKTEVKEIYKAYKSKDQLTYANKTTGTKNKDNSDDWYWACLDVSFNTKNLYRDTKIEFALDGMDKNNKEFTTDAFSYSFNDVKSLAQYYWGDGSEEEQFTSELPMSMNGGWQLEHEFMFGNMEIDAEWGFIFINIDDAFDEDYYLVNTSGSTYTIECYHGGRITMVESGSRLTLNVSEGCDMAKSSFASSGYTAEFAR